MYLVSFAVITIAEFGVLRDAFKAHDQELRKLAATANDLTRTNHHRLSVQQVSSSSSYWAARERFAGWK
ncbi:MULTISPECIES: hypothetical protein [unclassified Arthrobacter]|uniref:hypothetical protein n=1 Tax=unclassified Arthrobacter TaxID=235627 RepID=UPI00339250DF